MSKLLQYIKLLRVDQWVKNLFIFSPVLFAFRFFDLTLVPQLLWAFMGFSLIASSIYIINDWFDIESDRLHPTKKNRPLAAGTVGKTEGLILFALVFILGVSIYLFLIAKTWATILLLGYFVMNLAYSMRLKRFAILDIVIVAIGFVVRVFIGGVVANIQLSHWIIIMTFFLALLLVVGKRKHDVTIFENTGQKMRKSLSGYNSEFLNAIIVILVAIISISYVLYTISPEIVEKNGEYLYLTSIFVTLGLFRYLQVIFVHHKGDSPTKLLATDRYIQLDIIFWFLSFLGISLSHNNIL